jgi:hypothetical protein
LLELRDLARKVLTGEVDLAKVDTLIGIYSQTAKRENLLFQIAAHAEKNGKADKSWRRLNDMNLISENAAINIETKGNQVFKCPEQGWNIIDRENCLDYSGSLENIDRCQNCNHFSITRKQICSAIGHQGVQP